MKKTSFFNSLPFKLLVAVILGIIAGLILNRYSTNGISMAVLNITVTIKYILGQIITFCVPLIVLGFIAPSITRLGKNASLMLGVAVVLAYGSSVGAALFSTASGFLIIPHRYECSCFCNDAGTCRYLDKGEADHWAPG